MDAASGGMVLLGSYTASNVTSVDIGSGLDLDAVINSTYNKYLLTFFDVIPQTDGAEFYLRTSSDGGSSFDNGGSDYQYQGRRTVGGSGTDDASTSQTHINIGTNLGNAAGRAPQEI